MSHDFRHTFGRDPVPPSAAPASGGDQAVGLDFLLRFNANLVDGSPDQARFRSMIAHENISFEELTRWVSEARGRDDVLHHAAFQDLVHALARYAGFEIEFGTYQQGVEGAFGFHGLWSAGGATLAVNVYPGPLSHLDWNTLSLAAEGFLQSFQVPAESFGVVLLLGGGCSPQFESAVDDSPFAGNLRLLQLDTFLEMVQMIRHSLLSVEEAARILRPRRQLYAAEVMAFIDAFLGGRDVAAPAPARPVVQPAPAPLAPMGPPASLPAPPPTAVGLNAPLVPVGPPTVMGVEAPRVPAVAPPVFAPPPAPEVAAPVPPPAAPAPPAPPPAPPVGRADVLAQLQDLDSEVPTQVGQPAPSIPELDQDPLAALRSKASFDLDLDTTSPAPDSGVGRTPAPTSGPPSGVGGPPSGVGGPPSGVSGPPSGIGTPPPAPRPQPPPVAAPPPAPVAPAPPRPAGPPPGAPPVRDLATLEQIVRKDPGNLDAAVEMARLYLAEGRLEDALEPIKRVVKDASDHVAANLVMGQIYFRQREFPKAALSFEVVLNKDKSNVEARVCLGDVYATQEKHSRALKAYMKAAEDSPRPDGELELRLARTHMAMQNPELALPHLERAMECSPENVEIYLELGNFHLDAKNPDAALRVFQRGLEVDPENVKLRTYVENLQ